MRPGTRTNKQIIMLTEWIVTVAPAITGIAQTVIQWSDTVSLVTLPGSSLAG